MKQKEQFADSLRGLLQHLLNDSKTINVRYLCLITQDNALCRCTIPNVTVSIHIMHSSLALSSPAEAL